MMLVIEGHSDAQSSTHYIPRIPVTAVAGQTAYSIDVSSFLPGTETFAAGNVNPYTIYVNNANVRSTPAPAVTAAGVLTFTLPNASVAGDQIFFYGTFPVVIPTSERHIFPADRCTWTQLDNPNGGYEIDDATFWDGNSSLGTAIDNPRLGFIGKSGRFVQIAS